MSIKIIPITEFNMQAIKELHGKKSHEEGWRKPDLYETHYIPKDMVLYNRVKKIRTILYEIIILDVSDSAKKRPFSVQLTKWLQNHEFEKSYKGNFSNKSIAFQKAKDLMTKVNQGIIK